MPRLLYALLTTSLLVAAPPAVAQEDTEPAIANCFEAVGTYLMRRVNEGVSGPEAVGRSLLSLTNGGHALFTDSAQGGVTGFQPFTNGQGAWRCLNADNGRFHFEALVFDFTIPIEERPDPQIARVDILATFNPDDGTLDGSVSIAFAPLDGDPLDKTSLKIDLGYDFTGQRIELAD